MKILCIQNYHVKLDNEDYDKVIKFNWRSHHIFRHMQYQELIFVTYIQRPKRKVLALHRLIMHEPPKDYAVKFKDGDRFNMQKENLYFVRFCKLKINAHKRIKICYEKKI